MIPVVIVESHQHVLEHVHDVLRKKKLFLQSWSMVHFDAHPDMACSKTAPAVAFFNPRQFYSNCDNSAKKDDDKGDDNDRGNTGVEEDGKNLYELLDLTPSGIAEWILPLVLAAKLNKIEWVKPSFSSQIAEGNYQFAVGVEYVNLGGGKSDDSNDGITTYLDLPASAKVKVDFNHPYYLDDLSVIPADELVLKQELELRVSKLRSQDENPVSSGVPGGGISKTNASEQNKKLWMLDICLDYFACQNPYLSDLESRNPLATRAFLNVMEGSRFNINRINTDNNQPTTSTDYQTEIIRFYNLLKQLLSDNLAQNITKRRRDIDGSSYKTNGCMSFHEISKYFETKDQAERLIRQLMTEINDDDNDSPCLSSMITEAIPNWSMPHDKSSAAIEKINESLRLVEAHIIQHVRDNGKPFMITIARSTLDGFCPPQVVEILQTRVLDILRRQICGEHCQFCETDNSFSHGNGNGCDLILVRDYGEWEGSVIP